MKKQKCIVCNKEADRWAYWMSSMKTSQLAHICSDCNLFKGFKTPDSLIVGEIGKEPELRNYVQME